MRKTEKAAFIKWAIAYAQNPNANPSSSNLQALAIKAHDKMSDGKWRTSTALADELGESVASVRAVMICIKDADWGYEAIASRSKGYRRIN